ncbi:MAG: hypothetical protein U5K38_17085 [Woeseiaceae bacterium]|nr:hypothetical protein [Woeseiaceae bacterium]
MAAVPLSIAIGSPISGALLTMDGLLGLHGWQWLFLVEAAPAILLTGVVLVYLTDRPADAEWLDDEERDWLVAEMKAEEDVITQDNGSQSALKALANPWVLALALVYFRNFRRSVHGRNFVPRKLFRAARGQAVRNRLHRRRATHFRGYLPWSSGHAVADRTGETLLARRTLPVFAPLPGWVLPQ